VNRKQDIIHICVHLLELGAQMGEYRLLEYQNRLEGKYYHQGLPSRTEVIKQEAEHYAELLVRATSAGFAEEITHLESDDYFRDKCKERTSDKTKCEYCKDKFLCWTKR